jgi:hypothetical protein
LVDISIPNNRKQVALLIKIMPSVYRIEEFAMPHGWGVKIRGAIF